MSKGYLSIKTKIQVLKPDADVFEAIIDPKKMSNYFISSGSGRMEEGKTIIWKFPEFETDVPIRIKQINPNQFISFFWDNEKVETLVEIHIESVSSKSTIISVFEKSMENNEDGIKWLKENTEGWANFLASLKAYLEYGINLRKGAFDFMNSQKI
jgi:uncharacterized protein YndB with AHSA1/START domain